MTRSVLYWWARRCAGDRKVKRNFDSLITPATHPSRDKSDCYYINHKYLLRGHTTAHQSELINMGLNNFLVVGDVYRRDEIDNSHYPVFHQADAVRICTQEEVFRHVPNGEALQVFEKSGMRTEDKQQEHTLEATKLMETELKSTLLCLAQSLFGQGLVHRWVATTFPFTHPSWELEVLHKGKWVELLGCGIMEHAILHTGTDRGLIDLNYKLSHALPRTQFALLPHMLSASILSPDLCHGNKPARATSLPDEICAPPPLITQLWLLLLPVSAGASDRIGWAFGVGLERIAMILYDIPDIRLFWSTDSGFLCQFNNKTASDVIKYKAVSIYPQCINDISFWLPEDRLYSPNDFYDLVRNIAGDIVEQISLVDEFVHPKTQRISHCYKLVYRHMEKTLTQEEVNIVHRLIEQAVDKELHGIPQLTRLSKATTLPTHRGTVNIGLAWGPRFAPRLESCAAPKKRIRTICVNWMCAVGSVR
uniref:phenylalanine--tRNA ligase n=1 Tax=Timema cristinae TaxID=61476 RepID=A0A7R9GRD6_TIMCR|nr:unnamed protein product [Timema cristinae]